MRSYGIIVNQSGTLLATWAWNDPHSIFPADFTYHSTHRIIDLSALADDEANTLINALRQASEAVRRRLLQHLPVISLPSAPPPPDGWECCIQPGYRRVCYRPSQLWHQQEITARALANHRISAGEDARKVISEEFTHLNAEECQVRHDMRKPGLGKADVSFPLTPMVRLVEQKRRNADGTETLETVRHFPFHEPVAEF